MQFAALFQDRVIYSSPLEVVPLYELKLAAEASCTAQEPVKFSRVKALVTAILKDKQLWQPPKLVYITDTQETIAFGGRHRTEAIGIICRDYVVAPTGAVVPRSAATADCEEIEPTVAVIRATVRTRAEAASLLTSDNSSRSMTTAEKLYTEEFASTLTALAALKLGMTRHISGTHVYLNGESLEISTQTIKTMVSALIKAMGQKKALAMTEVQIDELCTEFSDFLEDSDNSQSWDTNFSRYGHKQAVADFLAAPAFDEDGELLVVEVEDEDGDTTEEEVTWFQNFCSLVVVTKAPKKSKKESKASEAQKLIEELQAELAALKAGMQ